MTEEQRARRRWLVQQVAKFDRLDAAIRDGDYEALCAGKALMRNAVANAGPEDLRVLLLSLRAQAQRELRVYHGPG